MRESIHCHFNIFGTGMCEQQQLTFENKILKNSKTLNWAVGWLQAVTGKVSTLSGSSSLGLSWTTHNFSPFISKWILSRFENLKFCQKWLKWPKSHFSNLDKIHLEMNREKLWVVHDRPRLELPESVETLPVTACNQPTAQFKVLEFFKI